MKSVETRDGRFEDHTQHPNCFKLKKKREKESVIIERRS